MSAEYSVKEVRKAINGFVGYSYAHRGIGGDLIDIAQAYANRIEADERAVDATRASLVKALMAYRCIRTVDEDGEPLPLVDALSPGEGGTIQPGTEEIEYLAEYLADELQGPPAQAAQVDVYEAYKSWPSDIRKKISMHDLRRMGGWASKAPLKDWRLDTSAGDPILCYQNCSVIESEQARYVFSLIAADQATHPHSPDAADSGRAVDEDERVSAFNKWWEEHKAAHPVNVGDKARAIAAWIASRTVALQDAALAAQPQSAASPVGVPDVVSEVMAELEKAIRKFPTWPTDPLHAVGVLNEEVGELNKAVLQQVYEPHKNPAGAVRSEALQSAAMAIRFLSSMSAYQFNPGDQHEQGQSK